MHGEEEEKVLVVGEALAWSEIWATGGYERKGKCYDGLEGCVVHPDICKLTVPQRFFLHFYVIAVLLTTSLGLSTWFYAYKKMTPLASEPLQFSTIASHLTGGSHMLSIHKSTTFPMKRRFEVWKIVLVLLMMEAQALRRLYETLYVFNYGPSARMHVLGYLAGLFKQIDIMSTIIAVIITLSILNSITYLLHIGLLANSSIPLGLLANSSISYQNNGTIQRILKGCLRTQVFLRVACELKYFLSNWYQSKFWDQWRADFKKPGAMAAKKVDALEERLEGEMNQIKTTVEERMSSMEGQVVDLRDMIKKITSGVKTKTFETQNVDKGKGIMGPKPTEQPRLIGPCYKCGLYGHISAACRKNNPPKNTYIEKDDLSGHSSPSQNWRNFHSSWMTDPKLDHGFVFDLQGRVDVLRSPFFDINLEIDHFVEDYIDRIFYSLTSAIDDHQPLVQWQILHQPSTTTSPDNSSLSNTNKRERGRDVVNSVRKRNGKYSKQAFKWGFYTAAPLSVGSTCALEAINYVGSQIVEFIVKGRSRMPDVEFFHWELLKPLFYLGWCQWFGVALFVWGSIHQLRCHAILGSLREQRGADEYIIPNGDWFEYVSCAHYLGEIVIYAGILLASGGFDPTVWLLFFFVVSNLVFAAAETHRWYHQKFESYPPSRKALIPWIY
ncbi:hypothetical protein M5K25_017677 [Dendrobium thyrsiflorum]|uniref:CCHC-type domain-containing protein n=1 Tax=Dendrobium thyrsiflorum TaxID=117978 RepID=A0ABD0UUM7_DENTH